MAKRLAYAFRVLGIEAVEEPPDERRACHKATRRALKSLPPTDPDKPVLTPADIQRRWIRGKCARCAKCPDMVL